MESLNKAFFISNRKGIIKADCSNGREVEHKNSVDNPAYLEKNRKEVSWDNDVQNYDKESSTFVGEQQSDSFKPSPAEK